MPEFFSPSAWPCAGPFQRGVSLLYWTAPISGYRIRGVDEQVTYTTWAMWPRQWGQRNAGSPPAPESLLLQRMKHALCLNLSSVSMWTPKSFSRDVLARGEPRMVYENAWFVRPKCRILHFIWLKGIIHISDHLIRALKSAWRRAASAVEGTLLNNFVSSAKSFTSHWTTSGRSRRARAGRRAGRSRRAVDRVQNPVVRH